MNEERLKRMVHLAMFEQTDGKKDIEISRYFRRDYIGIGLLKNAVLITIAYVIFIALYMIYDFENLAAGLADMNIRVFLLRILIGYLLVIGIFSVLIYVIRKLRYETAVRRMRTYHKKLRELEKIYEFEEIVSKQRGSTS